MMLLVCASIVIGALLVRKPLFDIRRDLKEMNHNVRELNLFFNVRDSRRGYPPPGLTSDARSSSSPEF
jgi:hypothetical protein